MSREEGYDHIPLHSHLARRMLERGILLREIQLTLDDGWPGTDAAEGSEARVLVFAFRQHWRGKYYEEKEVTVYFKRSLDHVIVLTAKARYGSNFPRG